jgi:hypothetical protein
MCARSQKINWWKLTLVAALVLILTSPILWDATHPQRVSVASSWAETPTLLLFVSSVLPPLLAGSLFAGVLVATLIFQRVRLHPIGKVPLETRLLLLGWVFIPLGVAFVGSYFSHYKVFVSRYYLPAFPAIALCVGWGIRSLFPERARVLVSAFVVGAAVLSLGGYHLRVIPAHKEDWRGAANAVRHAGIASNTPVLLRVGLIETAKPDWRIDLDPDSPLLCPLSKYPMPGRVILVPHRLDEAGIGYLENVAREVLEHSPEFVLVLRGDDESFEPWFLGRMGRQNFQVSSARRLGGISVLVFRRVGSASGENGSDAQIRKM